MKYNEVPGPDRIVRYAAHNRLHKDDNSGIVFGLAAQAFILRDIDDGKLSVTWCEYFSGTSSQQFHAAIKSLRNSMKNNCAGGGFGISTVDQVINAFSTYQKPTNVRVMHEPSKNNRGHSTVHNYRDEYADLLDLLANSVFQNFVLNCDVPP